MTSILKADTIQDTDGNNIINESSNTITIGASGDTINVPSGATFNINGTAGTGVGISGWSSSSGSLLPDSASAGIYLGVNSATAANLLDDYEEGTWTPVPKSGGTTITIYTPTASYTKVGRFVNIQFTIRRNDSASLTDVLQIEGLPFTSSSTAMDANINGGVWVDNSSGDHIALLNIGGNSDKIGNMRKTNTMDASIAADEWVNGRYLYGSANYVAS